MKKILVVLAIVSLVLAGVLVVPTFAQGQGDGQSNGQDAWEAMHEACEAGDWEAMHEAAEEMHGGDFESMPCHGGSAPGEGNAGSTSRWGGMGGHMGGGVGSHMGGGVGGKGRGGMMGWW